jgi:hypothetical protein
MYEDRYDNHFRRLHISRNLFATFVEFTLDVLEPTTVPKLIRDLRPALQAAHAAYLKSLSGNTTGSGQRMTGTQTEAQAFTNLRQHVKTTDTVLVQPYLTTHKTEEALFYPDKLSGLTQAPKTKRLSRFTAYIDYLEGHAEEAMQTAGQQARVLLGQYTEATTLKNKGAKAVEETHTALGTESYTLADILWEIHCAALYEHRKKPVTARMYFGYRLLPNYNKSRKRAGNPSKAAAADSQPALPE